ncbi:MAG: NAD(P)-dependent oxidoreductase [Planctomycetes bacterium]|nr:NAD(P)-dependent oxidoreductase [Planctomycetota bacterium]NOG53083.1 NAD(P)-dependent oxidoreductase [Planctomycetota bacterium]
MRVALTGASGFIGSVTARCLHENGHTVTALVRATSRTDHIEPFVDRIVVGDQCDTACWPNLLDEAECIIHNSVDWEPLRSDQPDLARHLDTNLRTSIRLLHAAAPRQFIFVSTVGVHHDMRPRWQGLIDEDHPLRPSSLYGAYKAAVEAHLWAAHYGNGQSTSALRPCAVYGIDPNLGRSIGYPIIQQIAAGDRFVKQGGGKFVHVEDVAAAIVGCVGNEATSAQAYNLADCYARWADLAVMASEILGVEAAVDLSSPASSANQFSKDAAAGLGVSLDRGHDGIRTHMKELTVHMKDAGVI